MNESTMATKAQTKTPKTKAEKKKPAPITAQQLETKAKAFDLSAGVKGADLATIKRYLVDKPKRKAYASAVLHTQAVVSHAVKVFGLTITAPSTSGQAKALYAAISRDLGANKAYKSAKVTTNDTARENNAGGVFGATYWKLK